MKDDIIRHFEMYFPSIARHAIETRPGKYFTLFVRLDNGDAYIYEDVDHYIRRLPSNSDEMTEDEFKKEFSRRLKHIMYMKGVTQEVLAERAGLSQPTISQYLSGKRLPNFCVIDKIARALKCPVDDLRYID